MSENHHIVDDEAEFHEEELEFLADPTLTQWKQNYHVLSIIGSQSSGKSTLLNELFETKFEVLNRKERIGQTTKGIWIALDPKLKIVILDVEGSDSKEREETRTKVERCNSLFALAVSNSLIVNIWKQQLGLWRGSQLAILEIVLQLNLKLFKSERPKEIIFVVRDFEADPTQPNATQQIQKNIFGRVEEAWSKINKPVGTENIKLQDLFHLNVFFLPSFRSQKELFREELVKLRSHLVNISNDFKLSQKNVLIQDIPQYLKNLWSTIQSQKDLNLPAQKILIANLRCNQIKEQSLKLINEPFNRIIDKATTTLNMSYSQDIGKYVDEALVHYDKESEGYPLEQATRIREQFTKELEHSIFTSFKVQVSLLSAECIETVTSKLANEGGIEQSGDSVKNLNDIRKNAENQFMTSLGKLAYKSAWIEDVSKDFVKNLSKAVEAGKSKILIEYLKHLDSIFKKKIDALVTGLLKDKRSFMEEGYFWESIRKQYVTLIAFGRKGIINKLNDLQLQAKGANEHYFQRSKNFCYEQLKSIVTARIKDLNYYLSRHFKDEFNFDNRKVPKNWPDIPEEQITQSYKKCKKQFQGSIYDFQHFKFDEKKSQTASMESSYRASLVEPTTKKESSRSSVNIPDGDLILNLEKMALIQKNYNQMCENEYKEANRKHNDRYKGRIPKWMLVLLAIFMVDDVILWFSSPALIIPITLVGVIIAVIVHKLGVNTVQAVVGQATQIGKGMIGSIVQSSKKKQ